METKHTPGPWKALIDGASPVKITAGDDIVGYSIFGPLCNVDAQHHDGVGIAEANARLIAAAPDLLAIVADVVAECEDTFYDCDEMAPPWVELHKRAKAAIARATGETV